MRSFFEIGMELIENKLFVGLITVVMSLFLLDLVVYGEDGVTTVSGVTSEGEVFEEKIDEGYLNSIFSDIENELGLNIGDYEVVDFSVNNEIKSVVNYVGGFLQGKVVTDNNTISGKIFEWCHTL